MPARSENLRDVSRRQTAAIRDYIASKITSHEWTIGDKLPTEEELVREFGAARNTVRKALSLLEAEGMIVRHVGRGTYVADGDDGASPMTHCSPADIMEARVALEPAIARLSAVRATGRDIAKAQECLSRLATASELADHEQADAELHWTIMAASRNELYKKIFNDINEMRNGEEWAAMKKASMSRSVKDAYHKDHVRIVEAFARRDGAALSDALKDHLLRVKRNLLSETY